MPEAERVAAWPGAWRRRFVDGSTFEVLVSFRSVHRDSFVFQGSAAVDALFVHEDLHGRPVRPNAELEHQMVGRPAVHADESSVMEQLQVMRVAHEREIPFVVGANL